MPTLESIGLGLSSLTASMSLSRVAQPLCGAILDNQYLLIGERSMTERARSSSPLTYHLIRR